MTHKFVVRMSEQQFNLLQEMAEINCSSVNKLINIAIDDFLEEYQMIDDLRKEYQMVDDTTTEQ